MQDQEPPPSQTHRRPWSLGRVTCVALATLAALSLAANPGHTQSLCDPAVETCDARPHIVITPVSGAVATGATYVEVTITWHVPAGVHDARREIYIIEDGNRRASPLDVWSFTVGTNTGSATSTYRVTYPSGVGVLEVEALVTDSREQQASAKVRYTRTQTTPPAPMPARVAPVVSIVDVPGSYDASRGSASLTFSTAPYVSLDTERSVSFVYHSLQVVPDMLVQVDVTDLSTDPAAHTSLEVLRFEDNVKVPLHNGGGATEAFVARGTERTHRMAGLWSVQHLPTGDYKYWVVVRSRWPDGAVQETRTLVRLLVVNESRSPIGRGWSIAGVQRLRDSRYGDGVVLTGGDGTALFFKRLGCSTTQCTHQSPDGDFSTLVKALPSGTWTRTWRNGTKVTFDAQGRMGSTEDRFGNRTVVSWGQNSRGEMFVWAIVDPAGRLTRLYYHESGEQLLRAIDDHTARTMYPVHNELGQLVSVSLPGQALNAFSGAAYSTNHVLVSYRDTRGGEHRYWYRPDRRLGSHTMPPVTLVPGGAQTRVQTQFVLPEGTVLERMRYSASAPGQALMPDSAFGWVITPHDQIHYRVDGFGSPTDVYSTAGQLAANSYYSTGLPRYMQAGAITTGYEYNAAGDVTRVTSNGKTSFAATYGTDNSGLPTKVTQGGATTWYRYGPRGELRYTWTGAEGDSLSRRTTYGVDARGRTEWIQLPDGRRTTIEFQTSGWLNTAATTETKLVGQALQSVTTRFSYNDYGLRSGVQTVGFPNAQSTAFDIHNRPAHSTDAGGGVTRFEYQGPDLISITDPMNKTYRSELDEWGRSIRDIHPDGRSRTRRYDASGRVVSATDRRGKTVTFEYDARDRLIRRTADGLTTTFKHDPRDRGIEVTNATGTIALGIDGYEQLLPVTTATFGTNTYRAQQTVDLETWLPGALRVSRSASGTPVWTHESWEGWDLDGGIKRIRDFGGRETRLDYDAQLRLAKITYPSGISAAHTYDLHARPMRRTFSGFSNTLGADYSYDAFGRLAARTPTGSDKSVRHRYDALGRYTGYANVQTRYVNPWWCNPSTDPGCVQQAVTDTLYKETYTYDAVGNRTDRNASRYGNSNRYALFDGFNLTYDDEGNLVRKFKAGVIDQTLTWNSLGQLTSVTINGSTVTYGYNGLGQRVTRTDAAGTVTRYLYHDGNLLMELSANGYPARTYTYTGGTDRPLSVTFGDPRTGATYWYVNETPGHVTALMNAQGQVINSYSYTPFGARSTTTEGVKQPLQYMARERDEATGLYYVRARWYDPDLARFVSEDPIGLAGGINTYAYAANDPINMRDPSGLSPACPDGVLSPEGDCEKLYTLPPLVVSVDHPGMSMGWHMYFDGYGGASGARLQDIMDRHANRTPEQIREDGTAMAQQIRLWSEIDACIVQNRDVTARGQGAVLAVFATFFGGAGMTNKLSWPALAYSGTFTGSAVGSLEAGHGIAAALCENVSGYRNFDPTKRF
ncbi:MAG TPA: RHS repeat-associated core domain-containing protein [Longimicrobium sp.]|nr:RHS repeat-associated core domain-containing protein [Longimicrobium sp.]